METKLKELMQALKAQNVTLQRQIQSTETKASSNPPRQQSAEYQQPQGQPQSQTAHSSQPHHVDVTQPAIQQPVHQHSAPEITHISPIQISAFKAESTPSLVIPRPGSDNPSGFVSPRRVTVDETTARPRYESEGRHLERSSTDISSSERPRDALGSVPSVLAISNAAARAVPTRPASRKTVRALYDYAARTETELTIHVCILSKVYISLLFLSSYLAWRNPHSCSRRSAQSRMGGSDKCRWPARLDPESICLVRRPFIRSNVYCTCENKIQTVKILIESGAEA